jgi:hypothetical protein
MEKRLALERRDRGEWRGERREEHATAKIAKNGREVRKGGVCE